MTENEFRYCLDVIMEEVDTPKDIKRVMHTLYTSNNENFLESIRILSTYLGQVSIILNGIANNEDWEKSLGEYVAAIHQFRLSTNSGEDLTNLN